MGSQGLARGREPRVKKATARAQQMIEAQQQRTAREKKAKAATKVARQPKLLKDKGDKFMYGPAQSYASPTLTGDDELDRLRFAEAEATHLLQLLAHRGDGDWQLAYQERQVDIQELRDARDNPGSNILKRKVKMLTSSSAKGKPQAVHDDVHEGEPASSLRETGYTGITIGRSPAGSTLGQKDNDARPTLQLAYPPPSPPKAKRPVPAQGGQPAAKKPCTDVDDGGQRKPYTDGAPAKTAKVLPSQPAIRSTSTTASKKPAGPSYGGPQPSTNLQVSSIGVSTHRRATPGDPVPQPNKPSISKSVQKRPRLDPPHLDPPRLESPHQEPPPHVTQPKKAAWPSEDRLYSVPPQPRSFVYRPTKKTVNPKSRANPIPAPQASVSNYVAPSDDNCHEEPPRKKARATVAADNLPNAGADRIHNQPSRTAKERGPPRGRLEKPPAEPRAPKNRPHSRPEATPKRASDASIRRGVTRDQPEEHPVEPRLTKNRSGGQPVPTAKRAANPPKKHSAHCEQPAEPQVQPQVAVRRPARDAQGFKGNALTGAASEDDADGQSRGMPSTGANEEGDARGAHIHRVSSDNTRAVNSYPRDQQPVIKRTVKRAKPWIVACGTFDWREGDPGEEVPTSDMIVARCFARACRELEKKMEFRDDLVKTVNMLITTYRNHTKALIVAVIKTHAGFEPNRPEFNRELSSYLLPDAFHEGEPDSLGDRQPFEADLVFKAVASTLFGPGKYGIKHAERFNPIPLRFLAYVCAIMNHAIYCYSNGYFNPDTHLESVQQELAFQEYLDLLCEMQENRPNAVRLLCGTLYDKAREEAARAVTRPVIQRLPRRWAPDIQEEYISRFTAPAPELNAETEAEAEAEVPSGRDDELEDDEDQVERHKARRGPNIVNQPARRPAQSQKKRQAPSRKGKEVQRPDSSDEELDLVLSNRPTQRRPQPQETSQPKRRKGKEVQRLDTDTSDDELNFALAESRRMSYWRPTGNESDDRGEGPSRPYGARLTDRDSDEDDLPSVRRAFLPTQEPSDPELEPSETARDD